MSPRPRLTYSKPRPPSMVDVVTRAVRPTQIGALLFVGEIRSVDSAYRFGGEELAILMRHASGREAMATVNRLRALVSGEFSWANKSPVTFSAGVAELSNSTTTARELIAAADAALYAAKHAGRNRVVLHSHDGDRKAG